jgi:hypothetical protein
MPDQGDGFLRAIKIHSTPSFGRVVKPGAPCYKILQHLKEYERNKKSIIYFTRILPICY